MRIYLCSRTAPDARDLNDKAARFLRRVGYQVFVPHEAPYNQADHPEIPDSTVYKLDMAEMTLSDACVVVGRIGADCGFEVGWFQAQGVPVAWYVSTTTDVGRCPMLYKVPKFKLLTEVRNFLDCVEREVSEYRAQAEKPVRT